MNINFRRLSFFCIIIAGFFFGGETAVRIKDGYADYPFFSHHRNLLAKPIQPIIPYRVLGWNLYHFHNDATMIHDAERNEYSLIKKGRTFRVVLFGEAETKTYARSLADILRQRYHARAIEIINVGHEAYALTHSLTLLAFDVLSWQPDLLIVSHNFNDREAAYFPVLTPDYSNKYGTRYFMPNYPNPFTAINYLSQWSNLYWALKEKASEWDTAMFEPSRVTMPELPAASKKLFVRNLDTFIAVAQSRHIPLIIASQPIDENKTTWDAYLKSRPYRNDVAYPLHEEFLAHHQLFNGIISERARAHSIPFVDLAEIQEPTEAAKRLADTFTRFNLINP